MIKSLKWLFSVLVYDHTDKCFGAASPVLLSLLFMYIGFQIDIFGESTINMYILIFSFLILLLPLPQLVRWKEIHLVHKVVGILYLILDLLVYTALIAFLFFRD